MYYLIPPQIEMKVNPISEAKPRFDILDGLRGVAAVLVIWYHFFEGFASSPIDQMLNHGYLAVDFFFVLSGFVIGYAYDGRWYNGGMTTRRFLLRRIVRLQPLVVLSLVLGAISFMVQGCVHWDGSPVELTSLGLALLLGLFMIPVIPGVDAEIRGYGEMFPLNGPAWSLFFEYIGSAMYALFLHRLSTRLLVGVVVVSGIALATSAITDLSGFYHIGFGWSMADWGGLGGFLRLTFSFSVGLLLTRNFKFRRIRGAFWICSLLIASVLVCPYIGGDRPSVLNAIYDAVCTLFIFPMIVYIGACGTTSDCFSSSICEFLGRISYPLYIIHYPAMYLFYAWIWSKGLVFSEVWPVCCGIFIAVVGLAWCALKFYDEPVRRWLSAKLR